ncbi:UV-stimulated scaffold protein A isoform X1 [Parasteatoda tepidariorum]|uniref:UV-stimulated scaffold protein A isoform X1 n=1 Tax=Parasteatoda tepidariorum TaxID=114398 RepID=UPI001C7235A6|nr:UV-stimulated scaffold protein A [Parasteatoda tepidariorum]XP_042896118.1 UV-stimulated scaffold protein A [Parasteatoda tepidariorum]XP_042896119.1 UV-stimulated scaffold protein A [Parasteatoda tepidariorum]XP_042896121.1 UV-stimulated scaffold protein A [Parasteatoda tepidariorum]XP_042896122.1 UV-stimulated scaffold protein A [Parasteatoda tepidariorum]XP_042896123.1 UV-stimulated scaffold protein A [Parasteatoda tepidariorum]
MSSMKEIEISKIIDSQVTSGKKILDETSMKKLKNICKSSNEYVYFTYNVLMTQLRKEHSEIRYSVLLIINELFQRSSLFRKLLENDLEEFLELVAESDPDQPLPLPQAAAKDLKLKSIEFLRAWTSKFGEKCVRLELALTYLQKCLKIDFSDMEARSIAERERLRREQEKLERIMNEKVNRVKNEMLEISDEISNTALQMENCFKLLIPHPTEFFSLDDFSTTEEQNTDHSGKENQAENPDIQSDSNKNLKIKTNDDALRHHGLHSMRDTITIELKESSELAVKVNEDNQPIVENLEDLYKEMSTRFFPAVKRWLKILTKGNNCTDTLKKAIDLKQLIESVFEKYKELKIKSGFCDGDDDLDDEDDDFIEVKEKEGYEAKAVAESCTPASLSQPSCSKTLTEAEMASKWNLTHSKEDVKDPTSAASTLMKLSRKHDVSQEKDSSICVSTKPADKKRRKDELLEKAPVLPYDIDLYHWEEEKLDAPEQIKYDLDKFWLTKDDQEENEALREAQIASMRTRKIDFSGKFEPVKFACRAPLPSGKLCPRKDRVKCPFHGIIVKRDADGKPIDSPDSTPGPSTSTAPKVPDWQDPSLLKDIEAATGVNLKIPQKKARGKKKECGLTNIKKKNNNVRERLSKKVVKGYKHYASKLDEMDRKRFNDKFGDQWNYY